jgi:hypothetical protein
MAKSKAGSIKISGQYGFATCACLKNSTSDGGKEPESPAGDQNCHLVQREVGRWRLRRSSLANNGPNFNTHRLTVS